MTTLTELRELRKKATRLSVSAWGQAEYELFIALVNWFDLPSTQALLDGSDKRDAERAVMGVRRWIAEVEYANDAISAYQLLGLIEGHKLSDRGKWHHAEVFERNARLAARAQEGKK